MSAADDVFETKSLFLELAERLAPRAEDKDQVRVLHRELREEADEPLFTWNRVFELLKGKARRVDAWEKDYAKRRLAELREIERRERETAHLRWIIDELGTTNPELARRVVDGLQHVVGGAGGEAGALALSDADHDQSREWSGYEHHD